MYQEWPLGKLPIELQRNELDIIKRNGYQWEKPHEVVDIFEKKVAKFSGSKYAVAVDSCSHGIFLVLKYLNSQQKIKIPKHTYVSVPMQIINAGYDVEFIDKEWSGVYQLEPLNIWDGAGRWTQNMFIGNSNFHVLSFQIKKRIPIGKGGIILCDDYEAYKWLKKSSYDGRDINTDYINDDIDIIGYHMYMTPEDAARGIILMDNISTINEDSHNSTKYPDLTRLNVFKKWNL
jgi:dTDP-4-amino-4,6-dideoxygalactose transaminase